MFKTEDTTTNIMKNETESLLDRNDIDSFVVNNQYLNSDYLNNNQGDTFEDINQNCLTNTDLTTADYRLNGATAESETYLGAHFVDDEKNLHDNHDLTEQDYSNNNLMVVDESYETSNQVTNTNDAQLLHSIFDCSQECFDIASKCQHQTIVLPSFKHMHSNQNI